MSDQTRAALDDAIRAHVADEGAEETVTHWAVAIGLMGDDEDESPLWLDSPQGQPVYVTAGLLALALKISTSEVGR